MFSKHVSKKNKRKVESLLKDVTLPELAETIGYADLKRMINGYGRYKGGFTPNLQGAVDVLRVAQKAGLDISKMRLNVTGKQ